jgi:cytochrome b561
MFYALMFVLPLVGRTMLSGGGYPIPLVDTVRLPSPVGVVPALFALLQRPHTLLASILFLAVMMNFGHAAFRAWVKRAGVFRSMVRWR